MVDRTPWGSDGSYRGGCAGCCNISGHPEDSARTGAHHTDIDGDVRCRVDWLFIFPQFDRFSLILILLAGAGMMEQMAASNTILANHRGR